MLAAEKEKYRKVWAIPDYHKHSPGKEWAGLFGVIASPRRDETALDIGCGDGAGGKELERLYGLKVSYLDFVEQELPDFICRPVWQSFAQPGMRYHYGYCCDVMEHIPEALTMLSVANMLEACHEVFFSISFEPDFFGSYIREPLHLTVKPFIWWRDMLREVGDVRDARDMIGQGVFHVGR